MGLGCPLGWPKLIFASFLFILRPSVMRFLTYTLLLVSLISSAQCQQNNNEAMVSAMARFDKAFIPVLIHTMEGDNYKAKRAALYVAFEWQKTMTRYRSAYPANEEWAAGFDRIDEWLGDALYEIDNNCAATAASLLEHVRYEWSELRRMEDITYYPDYWYDAQAAQAWLVQVFADEMMCQMEWEAVEEQVAELNKACKKAIEQHPDAVLYQMDAARLEQLSMAQTSLRRRLERFNKAMQAAQQNQMKLACEALGQPLWSGVRLFGDFEASRTYFAEIDQKLHQ